MANVQINLTTSGVGPYDISGIDLLPESRVAPADQIEVRVNDVVLALTSEYLITGVDGNRSITLVAGTSGDALNIRRSTDTEPLVTYVDGGRLKADDMNTAYEHVLHLMEEADELGVGATGPQGPAGQDGADGQDGQDGADGTGGGTADLPAGGTTGQVLGKLSATDDDYNWIDQTGGSGSGIGDAPSDGQKYARQNLGWTPVTDGQDGQDGTNGSDGAPGTNGTDGNDGAPGTNGIDGNDGNDGADGDGFTGGSYNASNGTVTFTSDDGLGFTTGDLRGADGTGGGSSITSIFDIADVDVVSQAGGMSNGTTPSVGAILKWVSTDGGKFICDSDDTDIGAGGNTGGATDLPGLSDVSDNLFTNVPDDGDVLAWDDDAGVVTFQTPASGGGSNGADGADGADGLGWTGGSYDAANGTVTFASTDGLGFTTGDLRGADGADGTSGGGGSSPVFMQTTIDNTSSNHSELSSANFGTLDVATTPTISDGTSAWTHTAGQGFAVPSDGVYELNISGYMYSNTSTRYHCEVQFAVDGTIVGIPYIGYGREASASTSITGSFMVNLTAGQKVSIQGRRSPEGSSCIITNSEGTIFIKKVS